MQSVMDEQGCEENDEADLDPRIQIELEKLNSATDAINSLEVELDEANTTFRMLLNESTRRLKALSKRLGSCIERARPYYEALERARLAQLECQRAAVQYQRANEVHQAAKETVALAEQRFLSNQHEWKFDNAWQEMLNHATMKVMEAETAKTDSEREHQRLAQIFSDAEQNLLMLEQKLFRNITKSRPYFEEKELCQGQLAAQKERVEALQAEVASVKQTYAKSLQQLEAISMEIHRKRGDLVEEPGIREPGVGAEAVAIVEETPYHAISTPTVLTSKVAKISPTSDVDRNNLKKRFPALSDTTGKLQVQASNVPYPELDYELELDRCDLQSLGSVSVATSSAVSDEECIDDSEVEELKEMAVKVGTPARQPEGAWSHPKKPESFESVRKLSENWERQVGETISRLGTILTLRPTKNPDIVVEDKEKY